MNDSRILLRTLFTLAIFCVSTGTGQAQSFDFEPIPVLNYTFNEAEIDIQLNSEEGSIQGSVTYRLTANINGADTLQLDAPQIQVDSVRSQGQSLSYSMDGDQLNIALSDSAAMGAQYEVQIYYRATPQFGLLKSSDATMWTSTMPRSTRHWLPVKDHPRIEMITTLSLQVPAQYTVFASGVRTDSEVLSTSSKRVTFRTGRPIPVSMLSFGVGQLRQEGVSMGIKRINSYAENGSISPTEQSGLVNDARQIIGEIEDYTQQEYPYQRLNIVILNDHYWEQKPYGASTIYLYKNRGDWQSQLRRGLYAQWFGVYRHEIQWANARPIKLLQTILHFELTENRALLWANVDEPSLPYTTVYNAFSAENWNWWQQYPSWDYSNLNIRQVTARLIPELLQGSSSVITGDSFEESWYQVSGQPRLPEFEVQSAAEKVVQQADSVRYRVDYNVQGNTLNFVFQAQQGMIQQPLTVPVQITSGGGTNTSEVRFSGSVDSVSIAIPAGTQNVRLQVPGGQNLVFEEHKPVPYALYQLRNGESPEARREAAIQLGYNTDNPDLQLALNDLMNREMEPRVEAALLRSYGKITAGAEGTQQRFLEALNSENKAVREAALEVVNNYQGSSITERLRTYSQNEKDAELSDRALNLYMQRIDSSAALEFTNTLVQEDTAGTKAIVAIEGLAEAGNPTQAVKLASFYIEPVYAYRVRKQALQVLIEYDRSAESWAERVKMLLGDLDPRIRYLAVTNIENIPGADRETISAQLANEYDARVRRAVAGQE